MYSHDMVGIVAAHSAHSSVSGKPMFALCVVGTQDLGRWLRFTFIIKYGLSVCYMDCCGYQLGSGGRRKVAEGVNNQLHTKNISKKIFEYMSGFFYWTCHFKQSCVGSLNLELI